MADNNNPNLISKHFSPGEEKRFSTISSSSVFTFGDFKVTTPVWEDTVNIDNKNIQFDSFSTLESLDSVKIEFTPTTFVNENELHLPKSDPKSYAYFSSFYSEVAGAINTIIKKTPYAICVSGNSTILNYSENHNHQNNIVTATFTTPISSFINQGEISINSASTIENKSLIENYSDFSIQLSGNSSILSINNLQLIDISGIKFLTIEVTGSLNITGSSSNNTFYIRPTKEVMLSYKSKLSLLETQLLYDGVFLVPDTEYDDQTDIEVLINWPRSIDGFNPDTIGQDFENYKTNILKISEKIDEAKTNIFLKTVIPENFLENDSDGEIYRTIIQTYAHEFDNIKKYIDAIAYAHTINYNNEGNLPNKFLTKFSDLIGFDINQSYDNVSIFDYLSSENSSNNSYSAFNLEIWRRILINIRWVYQKKGTRDAVSFFFKLLGAPEQIVNFNEFVYEVNQVVSNVVQSQTNPDIVKITTVPFLFQTDILNLNSSPTSDYNYGRINENGYINYDASLYEFQEGGPGRGNGNNYINQWSEDFKLTKKIDNKKVHTASAQYFGTQNLMNTKEIDLEFSPSKAVEHSIYDYFKHKCACWSINSDCNKTIPDEYIIPDCKKVTPDNISAMTFSQYVDFVTANNINPRDRKTVVFGRNSSSYPELKRIYLNYMMNSEPESSRLTIRKLEDYLNLLEVQLDKYMLQVIPETTIIGAQATTYKNNAFNRQKFVYKEGVNKGSEFKTKQIPLLENEINIVTIHASLASTTKGNVNLITSSSNLGNDINNTMQPLNLTNRVNDNQINDNLNLSSLSSTVFVSKTSKRIITSKLTKRSL